MTDLIVDSPKKSVHVTVLNTTSTTPMPNFESMNDADLKKELDRYGTRPMCRAKAVRMLKRIYEATHPVLSDSTPISKRVSRALLRTQKRPTKSGNKTREKRIRATITKITDNCQSSLAQPSTSIPLQNAASASSSSSSLNNPEMNFEMEEAVCDDITESTSGQDKTNSKKDIAALRRRFLEWLRLPEHKDLYYKLLTLNSIQFDQLITEFGTELSAHRISRTKFAELLDQLHVTYCVPQH